MRQIIAIHGADSYETYAEFWQALADKILHFDRLKFSDWKNNLEEDLGDGYEVVLPRMPNPQNAKYEEWKLWFEKLIPHLADEVILVGHSMGGVFLAKYLSENSFPKHVRATFLVAPPFDEDGGRRLPEFAIANDLTGFAKQGGVIFLYQSMDDPVVNPIEIEKYQKLLPDAHLRMFSDRQHFNQDHLPELVDDIRALS